LKNQKWRTAAISKTINRLPFYLLKVQNLYERTCYQFLFVVKRGCFKTSNINNSRKARKLNFAFITSTCFTANALRLLRRRRRLALARGAPPTNYADNSSAARRQFVGAPPTRCLCLCD